MGWDIVHRVSFVEKTKKNVMPRVFADEGHTGTLSSGSDPVHADSNQKVKAYLGISNLQQDFAIPVSTTILQKT